MDQFVVSTRGNKKYDVYRNGKYVLSFGDRRYGQYHDKLGFYWNLDHFDPARRANYYARHGPATYKSAKWYSHRYLW